MPLFISDRRLRTYKTLPRAATTWALDSGAFTELSRHGSWDHGPTPRQYAARIRRYTDRHRPPGLGRPPGLDVRTRHPRPDRPEYHRAPAAHHHQRPALRDADPGLPVIPVLQGWTPSDYLRCADAYHHAGINLAAEPLIGIGSICRRQATTQTELDP